MVKVEILSVQTAKQEYPKIFDTYASMFVEMSEMDIAIMVSIAKGICSVCNESATPCTCWKDD